MSNSSLSKPDAPNNRFASTAPVAPRSCSSPSLRKKAGQLLCRRHSQRGHLRQRQEKEVSLSGPYRNKTRPRRYVGVQG